VIQSMQSALGTPTSSSALWVRGAGEDASVPRVGGEDQRDPNFQSVESLLTYKAF
jgi:hypothetical protein